MVRPNILKDFSSGWYVLDDGIPYETVSNPNYSVDSHGDHDLYWYEPSGAHGLVDSIDPTGDFATMRQYILDRAVLLYKSQVHSAKKIAH